MYDLGSFPIKQVPIYSLIVYIYMYYVYCFICVIYNYHALCYCDIWIYINVQLGNKLYIYLAGFVYICYILWENG